MCCLVQSELGHILGQVWTHEFKRGRPDRGCPSAPIFPIRCVLQESGSPSALPETRWAVRTSLWLTLRTAFKFSRKPGTAPLTHIFSVNGKNDFITTSKLLCSVLVNSKFILGFHPSHKAASFSSIKTITLLVLALWILFLTLNLYLLFVRDIYHPALQL